MSEFLSSKILLTEDEPKEQEVPTTSIGTTGILGLAEQGPLNTPVLCTSFPQYRKVFGGYAQNTDLPFGVRAFFDNGNDGTKLYVVRLAHHGDVSDPSTSSAKRATALLSGASGATVGTVCARDVGTYGNAFRIDLTVANNDIEVTVSRGSTILGHWRGLSSDPSTRNYYARTINASSSDIEIDIAAPTARVVPETQSILLAGGENGGLLTAQDYIGDGTARTGIRAFDRVLPLSILAAPNLPPEAQRAVIAYCETTRRGRVFPVFDVPAKSSAESAAQYVQDEKLLESTEHGSIYWPRAMVSNPAPDVFQGSEVSTSPCGFVAGVIARNSAARPGGVYTPSAGIEAGRLRGLVGFDTDECLDENYRDIVYPARVNPLTTGVGLPFFIDGSRTLKSSGHCKWVAHRRGMSLIERDLENIMQYARHKPITSGLLADAYRRATRYLTIQMGLQAFASQVPAEAFKILGPSVDGDARIDMAVGLAFAAPAEFIWLHFSTYTNGRIAVGGEA